MRIVADTNILVRAAVQDDPGQGRVASNLLTTAELVAVPIVALCEFCWVLRSAYCFTAGEIADAIRLLARAGNVALDHGAVEAGLALLEAGGDFADGAIAHTGRWLGGETFLSFNEKAVRLIEAQGQKAETPR